MKAYEFRNLFEINEYFKTKSSLIKTEVYPIERRFINPQTKLLTSVITYVVITDETQK